MYLKKDNKNFDGYHYQNSGYTENNYQKNGGHQQQYFNNYRNPKINEVDDSFNDINSLQHSSFNNNNSFYDKGQFLHTNNISYNKVPTFSQKEEENHSHSLPIFENYLDISYNEAPNLNSYNQHPQHTTSSFYSSNHQYNPKQLFNNEDYQSPSKTNNLYLHHQSAAPPVSEKIPSLLTSVDTSCLDDILINADMSKSSSHWKSSFNGIREKYSNGYFNDSYNDHKNYSSTSHSLPRRNDTSNYLMKSTSYHTIASPRKIDDNKGLLQAAVERRVHESLELPSSYPSQGRKPGTDMGTFWLNTIRKSPIKQIMTAAERLEKLQEPAYVNSYHNSGDKIIKRTFISNTLPIKRSDNNSVASRKAIFSSPKSNEIIESRMSSYKSPTNHKNITSPHIDLSDLEDAVAQLTTKNEHHINNNSSSKIFSSSLSAGLHRFPIGDEYNNNNNNNRYNTTNKYLSNIHSPSPDSGGDISQSCPTDLPHPKPKHNLREQIINASIQSTPFINERQISPSRIIFPITNTGQVANKISNYEKKHSSPTPPNLLQLASQLNGNGMYPSNIDETSRSTSSSPCLSPVALSPKSSVFRTKPIIQFGANSYSSSSSHSNSTSPCTVNFQISTPTINGFQNNNNNTTKSYTLNTNNNIYKHQDPSTTYNVYQKEKCFSPRWKDDVADEATVVKIHQNVITSKNNGRTPTPTIEKINHQGRITQPSYDNSYSISSNNNNISNISITIPSPKNNIISTSSSSLPPPPSSTVGKSLTNIPSTVSPIPSYAGKLANVPRFYYPNGKPISPSENDAALRRVAIIFSNLNNGLVEYNEMYKLCDAIKVPTYWKRPIYDACMKLAGKPSPITTDTKRGTLTYQEFANYWNNMTSSCHDEASRFIYTLAIGNFNKEIVSPKSIRNHILKEDFIPMLTDLIETYPGLDFLRDAPNFHMRYIDVVTVRIFWSVNRSWSGKITASELRKSNFLQTIKMLDETTDINKITDFFSYEHFYVTYCKFWEIDEDHDLIISQDDMKRHCNGAIPSKVIERIFSSAVNRRMTKGQCNGKFSNDVMGFQEFVAFLLAEEDKKHPTSIEYWFRVIDLDGDGVISLNEMEYFHTEIMQQMEIRNYEGNSLKDVICNLLDMISPAMENKVTLCDIKRSGLAHRFFNAFVNVYKFIDQETTDGERPSIRTEGDKEMSDWDAFCAVEYENLMTENNDSEVMDDEVPYDENIDINLFEDE